MGKAAFTVEVGLAAAFLAVSSPTLAKSPFRDEVAQTPVIKSRVIVITDIGTEPDDIESMVRLLTYANEIDIEGLIAATSRHLTSKVHPELIEERIEAYAKVLPNLRVHDPRYPDAAVLRARIRAANPGGLGMEMVGKGKESPASQLIVETVDKADARIRARSTAASG